MCIIIIKVLRCNYNGNARTKLCACVQWIISHVTLDMRNRSHKNYCRMCMWGRKGEHMAVRAWIHTNDLEGTQPVVYCTFANGLKGQSHVYRLYTFSLCGSEILQVSIDRSKTIRSDNCFVRTIIANHYKRH